MRFFALAKSQNNFTFSHQNIFQIFTVIKSYASCFCLHFISFVFLKIWFYTNLINVSFISTRSIFIISKWVTFIYLQLNNFSFVFNCFSINFSVNVCWFFSLHKFEWGTNHISNPFKSRHTVSEIAICLSLICD